MYHAANPELRRYAYRVFRRAVRCGRLYPPKACQRCRITGQRLHGHHDDYGAPLRVTWLCPRCHRHTHTILELESFDRSRYMKESHWNGDS